jgi:hypothetical protein
MRQAWICEWCFTPFRDEKAATACEKSHLKMGDVKLAAIIHTESLRELPNEIIIEYEHKMFPGLKQKARYVFTPTKLV